MPTALLLNCHSAHRISGIHNRGSAAVYISTIEILQKSAPGIEFVTSIQMPPDLAADHKVRIIRNKPFSSKSFSLRTVVRSWCNLSRAGLWSLLVQHSRIVSSILASGKDLRGFAEADVIVDVSMDLYGDDFGSISVVEHSKDILIGVLMRKPVVIWAQSVGPFRSRWTSWLARLALERVALITVREETSLSHLRQLGVKRPPIYVTADPAFLLEPASTERLNQILSCEGIDTSVGPLIGVTMSWTSLLAESRSSRYLEFAKSGYRLSRLLLPERLFDVLEHRVSRLRRLNKSSYLNIETMSQVVDYLVEKLGATVLLIPHDTDPVLDDRLLAQRIGEKVQDTSKVKVITGMYSAAELKAIIGRCDLFVGGKMHANIAALSTGVPTLAVQYHHKFKGIMQMLGQEEYVCTSVSELMGRIDVAWVNRDAIRNELKERSQSVREKAMMNGSLVRDVIQSGMGAGKGNRT